MRGGPSLDVFVYGDYACPWTYIAEGRLELLTAERPLRVRWRPLPPPGGRLLPGPAERLPGSERQDVQRAAAELGLPLALPIEAPDTREAHQAAEFARDLGELPFRRLRRRLFRACLAEGRDVGDRGTLLELAETAGVDATALAAALDDGRYEDELDTAAEEAERYGIDATPTFLFGRLKVVGAVGVEAMDRLVDRALG